MAISKHKKRYMITLTPAVVERFQGLSRDIGLPVSTMSAVCEDSLKSVADVFQAAKDKGTFEISDLLRLFGQQMELVEDERRTNDERKISKKAGEK
jgi:hypothetical protein